MSFKKPQGIEKFFLQFKKDQPETKVGKIWRIFFANLVQKLQSEMSLCLLKNVTSQLAAARPSNRSPAMPNRDIVAWLLSNHFYFFIFLFFRWLEAYGKTYIEEAPGILTILIS